MSGQPARGLFVTGTDTGVGKTHVAAQIVRTLVAAGKRVGVYKPVASGCMANASGLESEDARALWEAAGRPGELQRVCPQRFAAPLAPHQAARAERRSVDDRLLRSGLSEWTARCEIVVVEGAGGLLSPVSDDSLVADLAADFDYPLVIVAANRLGAINHTLLTIAAARERQLPIAGIVLNDLPEDAADPSRATNLADLAAWAQCPLLADVPTIDWFALAAAGRKQTTET
jgi:dethiobiotin synthetase